MATVYEKFAYQSKAIKAIESNLKRIRNFLGVENIGYDATDNSNGTAPVAFKIKNDELLDDYWVPANEEYKIDPDTDVNEHKLIQDGSMCKLLGEMEAAIALPDIDANLKEDLTVIVDAFQRLGFRPVPKG